MKIPGIDSLRGIFEIFVPGLFLFFNFILYFIMLNFIESNQISKLFDYINVLNSGVFWLILFVFSYMLGVMLRIFKPDRPDHLSAMIRRMFSEKALKRYDYKGNNENNKEKKGTDKNNITREKVLPRIKKFLVKGMEILIRIKENLDNEIDENKYRAPFTNEFPYISWLGKMSEDRMLDRVKEFYKHTWAFASTENNKRNKQFFNLSKVLLCTSSQAISDEVYSVESFTRYVSGLFYALYFSFILQSLLFMQWRMDLQGLFELNNAELSLILIAEILIIILMMFYRVSLGYLVFFILLLTDTIIFWFFAEFTFQTTINLMMSVNIFVLIIYIVSICTILWKFRTIRIREVDFIFAASFSDPSFWLLAKHDLNFSEFSELWINRNNHVTDINLEKISLETEKGRKKQ